MSTQKESAYERYLKTWSGQQLLKKHSLNETGTWKILGEDPNCDMGGHHYQPELGLYEGKLEDVVRYGVELPRFWNWGGGGDFIKLEKAVKIDSTSVAARDALLKKKAALKEELAKIEKELKSMGVN